MNFLYYFNENSSKISQIFINILYVYNYIGEIRVNIFEKNNYIKEIK